MTMLDDKFSEWTTNQKLNFLESLSHNLTVEIRCIWSDESLAAADMVERIKWINELHHRVPLRAKAIRRGDTDWVGDDIGLGFAHWCKVCPAVTGAFKQSVKSAIEIADSEEG